MPRGNFPPTPAPSTDIVGKENAFLSHSSPSLLLPPSAMGSRSSESSDSHTSSNDFRAPLSPTSPKAFDGVRKQAMTAQQAPPQTDITLPPPPTRSRKIIQMKPGPHQAKRTDQFSDATVTSTDKAKTTSTAGGKRKQGPTTSAGRKIARKTAHSIIERRRRSKMNEEFGVLKDMIPACNGQEMHKLAILQASIEYLRYLEQCVADLKTGRNRQASSPSLSRSRDHSIPMHSPDTASSHADDSDEEMENNTASPTPGLADTLHSYSSTSVSASPAFSSTSHRSQHLIHDVELPPATFDASYPQSLPHVSRHPSASYTTSPTILSNTTSPMIPPQNATVLDHEASAALLMLNATDRRLTTSESRASGADGVSQWRASAYSAHPRGASSMRGMSVQDLLRS